jgi:predicted O-linked N-acetylglucosamine transferase (SPINDLY family)
MNDATIACWAGILNAVTGSRLFLKTDMLERNEVAKSVCERFARHGIDADRLILEGKSSYEDYLKSYQRVDIALDPFPYGGGTITVEALWMGVPVLTLHGDRHVTRSGASIMQTMAMPEWVAADEADYLARGVALAMDLTSLEQTRAGLRDRYLSSPLCDSAGFGRNLERAFRDMWRRWCDGRDPGTPK